MQKYLNGGYVCEDTKKAKVSYSDLYAGLFSWNHIFECCFDRYVVDVGIWSEWFRSQYLGYDLKSFDYMWYVAQIRLLPAGGLAILGGTKFRKIAAYLFLLWAGLASGMILTSALLMLGVKGLILCVISMLPHFLCYIPAYAMLLLYLFRYPVSEWNSTKTLSFVLFLTMGIALECLVNPVLLKMFLRTL